MLLYVCVISVCWLIFATGFSFTLSQPFWQILLWIGAGIALIVIVDGLTAAVVRLSPPLKDGKFFVVSKTEKTVYEKWKIRKWKDVIPEIGHFTGFRKNKLDDPKSVAYVDRFLLESRYGEIGHLLSCFTGCLILLAQFIPAFPARWWMLCIGVIVVNAVLNMLPYFVLRYNYYKLTVLRASLVKKQAQQSCD